MILVDTSIWIDHLGASEPRLEQLLHNEFVLMHPFIVGELALGSLNKRDMVLGALTLLPQAVRASHDEAIHFLHAERLFGKGIGYVDLHLLASTRLTPGASLWTKDKRLGSLAKTLNLSVEPPLYH
ncbi:Probable ribonuclease VapC32 [Achromobacter spanius]|uniref:type II toxin-antitoxin system VapC family toxin n=1 Tax=Achromobacter spanius TaxID=217203 RepID=UPI000C2C4670|nr:type II toxin-antitoxin system VapC family toxin [Achromobacter spanius]AUA54822.1 VapC toxin family PIN domain ribonuclease [Achromobacter spanius]CAB3635842.1 Ribonuclease VapC32 [Achromobacter spanius]SPT39560.1 Probable ribonuclease VapC32 [Achromobacter denitrificans]VEE57765.1 Probable ribonuclease VapC32 [Achromobacter spanius]